MPNNERFANKNQLKDIAQFIALNSTAPLTIQELEELKNKITLKSSNGLHSLNPYFGRSSWSAKRRWLTFDPQKKKGLIIKAGTTIRRSNGLYTYFDHDTSFDFSSETLTPGKDYFVNFSDAGELSVSMNKLETGETIGRFHTLCEDVASSARMRYPVALPATSVGESLLVKPYSDVDDPEFYAFYNKEILAITDETGSYDLVEVEHPLAGFEAGDILPESVFCDSFHPATRNEDAMVYDVTYDHCVDIYLQSGSEYTTKSAYGEVVAISRYYENHLNDLNAVGKDMLSDGEFTSAALGSNECTALSSSSPDTTLAGGHLDSTGARMISAIGCEDCCGYKWQWLKDLVSWTSGDFGIRDGSGLFGKEFGDLFCLCAGGDANAADACGSRSRSSGARRSTVGNYYSARGKAKLYCNY